VIDTLKSLYSRYSMTVKIVLILIFATLVGYRFYTVHMKAEQTLRSVDVSIKKQLVEQEARMSRYDNEFRIKPLINRHYTSELIDQINGAQEKIKVMMYVVKPSEHQNGSRYGVNWILKQLRAAMDRGVDVKFLIGRNDARSPRAATQHIKILERLEHDRFEGYVFPLDQSLHAKLVLVDEKTALTGAHNWTWHSLNKSHETSLLVRGERRLQNLHGQFDQLFRETREYYDNLEAAQ